jgi:hypothetical protein
MSVLLMSMVFERYPCGEGRMARQGEMMLALALADKADDDGTLLRHRSVVDLARKTRQSERGVRLQLQHMVAIGWLQVVEASDGGRGKVSLYRISPPWVSGGELKPPVIEVLPGAETLHPTTQTLHSVPCLENNATRNPTAETLHPTAETLHSVPGFGATEKGRNPESSAGAYITNVLIQIPPIPPKGGDEVSAVLFASHTASDKRKREAKPLHSLQAWLSQCRDDRRKPVPQGDPVFAYCDEARIGLDVLELHWWQFKRRRSTAGKLQRDWLMTFRNSVEGNWYRLWYLRPGQAAELSTQGLQAQAARAAEQRLNAAGRGSADGSAHGSADSPADAAPDSSDSGEAAQWRRVPMEHAA